MIAVDLFEAFWGIYPRRTAKAAAKKSWERCVIKMKLDADAILEGCKRYADAKRGADEQFIAHASTWLNNQRWLDEAPAPTEKAEPIRDTAMIARVSVSVLAHDLKKKLIERTRWQNWSKIERAAKRIDLTPQELWGAMRAGSIGIDARAWKFASAEALDGDGMGCPEVVPIEEKHWIDARERAETRKIHIRGMLKERWSPLQQAPTIHTKENRNEQDPVAGQTSIQD